MTSKQPSVLNFCVRDNDQPERYSDHVCPQCATLITGKVAFEKHLQSCEKHYCKVCQKTFHSNGTYQKHLRTNCPPKRYFCQKCNTSYSRSSDAQSHERQCNIGIQHKCTKCEVVFLTAVELQTHTCQAIQAPVPITQAVGSSSKSFNITGSSLHDKSLIANIGDAASIVLFDTETTGLIQPNTFPEIIEVAFVAVDIDNLQNPATNNIPRALNKLTLCLQPKKRIGHSSRHITGKCHCVLYMKNHFCDISTMI